MNFPTALPVPRHGRLGLRDSCIAGRWLALALARHGNDTLVDGHKGKRCGTERCVPDSATFRWRCRNVLAAEDQLPESAARAAE